MYHFFTEGEVDRIVQTSRNCVGTNSHTEISQEYLSKGSKRMSFVPFLPKIIPKCRKIVLQFRMVTKPPEIDWVRHEYLSYEVIFKNYPFFNEIHIHQYSSCNVHFIYNDFTDSLKLVYLTEGK